MRRDETPTSAQALTPGHENEAARNTLQVKRDFLTRTAPAEDATAAVGVRTLPEWRGQPPVDKTVPGWRRCIP